MRVFIAVLVLIFSFQSWTKADDIRDFQIEGISIGDSLLDYFSKKEIEDAIDIFYDDDEYFDKEFYRKTFKKYDGIQIGIKKNDSKYIIYSIAGFNFYEKNINRCFKQVDEVSSIISKILKDFKKERNLGDHPADPSGKSKYERISFHHNTGRVYVECWDWSDEITRKKSWTDNFGVSLSSNEYHEWLSNKAYN